MVKVLLIDDERTILENLKFILELEGYEVLTAAGGRQGIGVFRENPDIGVVVSDMRMPGMNGIDVLRAIREIDPDIGVIILTGDGDIDNAIQSMKEGASDYLSKPVHADKLILCIENAVKKTALIRENRRLNQDIIRKNAYFQHINESAQQILLKMLPEKLPDYKSIRVSTICRSCDNVGGDMYDVFEIGDTTVFYIFDVCGHGILSAVMTMMLKTSFGSLRYLYKKAGIMPDLEEMMDHINSEMYSNSASNLYATMFAGVYDKNNGTLTYISAGHVDQYLVSGDSLRILASNNTVIGIFDEMHFVSESIRVSPGDRLYLFTDGITEIWHDDILNMSDEIIRIVTENRDKPLEETVSMIYGNLIRLYSDKKPDDDVTIMGVEFMGSPEGRPA